MIMKDLLYSLRRLHGNLHDWKRDIYPLYRQKLQNPEAVFLVFTPEHNNLGDHAIAQSETTWLEDMDIPYIELTGRTLETLSRGKCLNLMNGRTILIHGGGYMGTIWPESEALLRQIIEKNPRSRILLLPNTIYYEEDAEGRRELAESQRIYNAHKHLKLYAREKISYETMKALYRDVAIAPDLVLRMNRCKDGIERSGCILCLRSDQEKTRSEQDEAEVKTQITQIFGGNVSRVDMIAEGNVPVARRDQALELQFDRFRHAELVITDRLHGMIFCAITGTPCIVINSKSPKVLGCYEWIKQLPYIRFCEDVRELTRIWQSIPKRDWKYDPSVLLPLYEPLKNDILRFTKGKRNAEHQCDRSDL